MQSPQEADPNPPFLSFADLMSSVGSFMFHWSMLEQGLTDAINEARTRQQLEPIKVRGAFALRLEMWRKLAKSLPENGEHSGTLEEVCAQALALKDIRNLITHGLCGGNSQPDKGEPHIRCVVGGFEDPSGRVVQYTMHQLEIFTQGTDACRRAFLDLRNFNYRAMLP